MGLSEGLRPATPAPAITVREPDLEGGLPSEGGEPGQGPGRQRVGPTMLRNDRI